MSSVNENAVMNLLFKALQHAVKMVPMDHANNQIAIEMDDTKWMISVTPIVEK